MFADMGSVGTPADAHVLPMTAMYREILAAYKDWHEFASA